MYLVGTLPVGILGLVRWSVCALTVVLCVGCQTEAIIVPRGWIEPPPLEDRPAPEVPPPAMTAGAANLPPSGQPGEQNAWIHQMLAGRNGEISLRDALLVAISNSEVVRTVVGTTGFAQV
ncbi:MAG: hypothetical protein HY290_17875, partial [Planctomycetia bacterium]|nr:hypothetical protein [Planctomycetia bacterium]